jgi:hypothetical protein
MASKKKAKTTKSKVSEAELTPFHERFEIQIGVNDARQRFIRRVSNYIFGSFFDGQIDSTIKTRVVLWQVANALGEEYKSYNDFKDYVRGDFHRCLHVLEVSYNALTDPAQKLQLNNMIVLVLSQSEIDLGVSWQKPFFTRSGARLLDQHLVNEPLRWLSDPKYRSVYAPFEKGLSHFLEAEKKPLLLADVITDMYESVEALSKVVTGRNTKDLSANAEMLIKMVRASDHYKQLLKDYISYANQFRHAVKQDGARPVLSISEVESFIYLTGLFIRLAIKSGS